MKLWQSKAWHSSNTCWLKDTWTSQRLISCKNKHILHMLQVALLLPRSIYHVPNLGQDDPLVTLWTGEKSISLQLCQRLPKRPWVRRLQSWLERQDFFEKLNPCILEIYLLAPFPTSGQKLCGDAVADQSWCDYRLPEELTGLVSLKSLVSIAAWEAGRCQKTWLQAVERQQELWAQRSAYSPTNRLPQPICCTEDESSQSWCTFPSSSIATAAGS